MDEKMTQESNVPANNSNPLKEYYSKIDFSFWDKELDYCFGMKEDGTRDDANPNAIRIYSTYLQFIEVLFINVFTITENNLENLFLNNFKLREKIEVQGKNQQYKEFLLEKWVFGIEEKSSINNYEQKKQLYSCILDEWIDDYLQDYDLLNAYKHGFRAHAPGPVSISLSADSNPDQRFLVSEHNCSVNFFSKEGEIIFERIIGFNRQRVLQKCEFILNILQNTKQILQAEGQKIDLVTLYKIEDSNFDKLIGAFRWKAPVHEIKKADGKI